MRWREGDKWGKEKIEKKKVKKEVNQRERNNHCCKMFKSYSEGYT